MKKKEIKKEEKVEIIDKKKSNYTLLIVFGILFIILSVLVFTGVMKPIDDAITSYIIGIRNTKLTDKMINITNIGGAYSLIVVSLLLLVFIKKKKIPLFIIINLVSVFLTSQLLKIIFRRPRPDGLFLINETGFSYPSGHAMVSFAYILFIIYILKGIKNNVVKVILSIFLIILALAIGFSRIYLGVHYFSDIIAAYFLSVCYISIFINFVNNKGYLK